MKGKAHFTLEQATKSQVESRGITLLFFNHGTRWWWVVKATLRPLYPGKETRYPVYMKLGGAQGRSGRVWKTSPPPGYDTRTVLPIASRYTVGAIPAQGLVGNTLYNNTQVTEGFSNFDPRNHEL